MSYKRSLEEILNNASVVLTNAQKPEIAAVLLEYGYTNEKLAEGSTLLSKANELFNLQKKEYGDQFDATDSLVKARDDAEKVYKKHMKLARLAFTDDRNIWQELGLNGIRKKTISGWLAQADLFYKNALANPNVKDALAGFGITEEKLTEGESLFAAVASANAQQEHEKSEAQQATLKRDEAIDDLNEWISKLLSVAKIAFEDDPQVLEALGIVAR